jgi:hypothetical protein
MERIDNTQPRLPDGVNASRFIRYGRNLAVSGGAAGADTEVDLSMQPDFTDYERRLGYLTNDRYPKPIREGMLLLAAACLLAPAPKSKQELLTQSLAILEVSRPMWTETAWGLLRDKRQSYLIAMQRQAASAYYSPTEPLRWVVARPEHSCYPLLHTAMELLQSQ